ncbi:TMEM67 [Anthophora plagiata]
MLTHTLPVLIKNINQNTNVISNWQFVRKFFFIDNISGSKISNFSTSNTQKVDKLSILRYLKTLSIIINIQDTTDKDKIFPPVLIIEYAELTHEQINKIAEVTLDYKIKFTIKDSNIDSNIKVTIGFCLGLALTISGIRAWSYSKRHHKSTFNIFVLIWFFVYIISSVGNVILLCVIGFCFYLFIFYEGQTIPYILLPENINEKTIKIFTIIAFFFKFIEVLGFMYQYWHIDILFIDWEQSKTMYNRSIYNKYDPLYSMSISELNVDELSTNRCKLSETSSEIATAKRKKSPYKLNKYHNSNYSDKSFAPSKYKTNISSVESVSKLSSQLGNENSDFTNLSVSIWRTYFVANEWLNLQTKRKINVTVQLLCVVCTYQIIQLYPWILRIPKLTCQFSEDNYNFTLHYTVCILIYISIYCIQWLTSVVFLEPCITNRMQEFVNLCSTANISVFILPFNYYGFYIHGRSVHGFADVDLPTLINNLQMEKSNLCAHRGLVPGTTQQTFILCLTKTFRIIFDTVSGLTKIKRSNFLKAYACSVKNGERIFNARLKLKHLLCKFVDHCLKHEDYIIKEQHFFEKLFNIIFSCNEKKSIFYIDNNYSFNQVLLHGNEWLLATFEISMFTFIIVLCEDCIMAVTLTVLTSILLSIIIKHNGKRNLSNNTLLDKTFILQ